MFRRSALVASWSFCICASCGMPLFAQPIANAPEPGIVDPAAIKKIETAVVEDVDAPVVTPGRGIIPARAPQPVVQGIPRGAVVVDRTPDVLPAPTLNSEFGIPEGLKTAPEILLPSLGYGSASSFPLTPRSCFEVASKCYASGKYLDAMAFTNHGLKLCNHARLYLLKALCEMNLNRPVDATETLVKYRIAAVRLQESIGLGEARERLNGPVLVRIDMLMQAWSGTP